MQWKEREGGIPATIETGLTNTKAPGLARPCQVNIDNTAWMALWALKCTGCHKTRRKINKMEERC